MSTGGGSCRTVSASEVSLHVLRRGCAPAAHAAVHAPQVAKYCMPLSKPSARCRVSNTPPIGKPLPMGLPSVTMSGTTPCRHKCLPSEKAVM